MCYVYQGTVSGYMYELNLEAQVLKLVLTPAGQQVGRSSRFKWSRILFVENY
eukprot:SAG11_NODE_7781_length_1096_cov_1.108216_1_plen_51_part_10